MSPPKPPKRTPPGGYPVQSDEDRALKELARRRAETRPEVEEDAAPNAFPKEEVTHPLALIDPDRYKTDGEYRHDWDEVMRQFNENAAYRLLWERSGRSRRDSEGRATASANAALAASAEATKVADHRAELAKLADPRTIKLNDAEADKIVARATPIYYITGTIHSPETGAPTALMELAYRLAVDESP